MGLPTPLPGGFNQQSGSSLIVTVMSEDHALLDRQALVKLHSLTDQSMAWGTTQNRSEATFLDLAPGQYEIEVSAAGFLTTQRNFFAQSALQVYRETVILKRDPSSNPGGVPAAPLLPSKARKEIERGVAALKSGDQKEAQKRLEAAYKLAPTSPDVNFLLGFLFLQKNDFEHAQVYLLSATKLDAHNVQALTTLGRLRIQQNDYASATKVLEQAVSADPEYWTAHSLLANSYLEQQQYDKASEQARLAIEKGKGAAETAQIVLGEALANLGRDQGAIQALKTFLQNSPSSPAVPQVRNLIAQLEDRSSKPAANSQPASRAVSLFGGAPSLFGANQPKLSIRTWEPPGIDDVRPPVAPDVTCPVDVIDKAGTRVKELVDDLAKFSATEEMLHEDLDELGHPVTSEMRKFDYVVAISEPERGTLLVNEFRTGLSDVGDFPGHIATLGVPSLAFVFHPDARDYYEMTCEGLGEWHSLAAWLLHFRQRTDQPNHLHAYTVGTAFVPAGLKGRAWISADTMQIVRVETELLEPLPKIQLLSEHQAVEYGPVLFKNKNTELWLPKTADLYFAFRRHRYHRRHSFDHFKLFSVDSNQKITGPKDTNEPQGGAEQSSH